MYVLQLRKKMFAEIYAGRKTSTSRQGYRRIVPESKLRLVAPDGTASVEVFITDVIHCKFDELTHDEAIREGYSSLEEMKEVLRSLYDIEKDDNFTLIRFEVPETSKR